MKDMDKAVDRISRALAQGERIAVFGDYDVDGITATVLLVDYLRSRGADCLKYIPRRVEDGYGLGREALRLLRDRGVTLVITVDCGITGVEEALFAREIGVDLVITDHHECKDVLPRAAAVVDPGGATAPTPLSIWPAWAWPSSWCWPWAGGGRRPSLPATAPWQPSARWRT